MSESNFQAPRYVMTIPATNAAASSAEPVAKHRRVAAYARVSTNSDEQRTSYEAQVSHYTRFIQENEEWTFVKVYTDKGVSGVRIKRRDGFNSMMQDALDGKIDLIITKSVSRFARNTVDSLISIRKLKDKGVEVFFEEQNIYTLDSKGEVLLSIMAALAQDESRNISENVTWGQRKRFEDGKVTMPYGRFLGYRRGENGTPEVVKEEAEIIRRIYREFIQGLSPSAIAKGLKRDGILTPGGKSANWQSSVVHSILSNEKYKGDALLQKSFTVDFLTKKTKKNEGEIPQFYVIGSHPAIIEPDIFDEVQCRLDRKGQNRYNSAVSIFSGKLICADCGAAFGSKVWHSTDQYRRTIWQCNAKFKNEVKCTTPHLTESEIKESFLKAFHQTFSQKEELLQKYRDVLTTLTETTELEVQREQAQIAYDAVIQQMKDGVKQNATVAQDQTAYQQQYNMLLAQADAARERIKEIGMQINSRADEKKRIQSIMRAIGKRELLLTEFDDDLWLAIVDRVIVSEKALTFLFKDGAEYTLHI